MRTLSRSAAVVLSLVGVMSVAGGAVRAQDTSSWSSGTVVAPPKRDGGVKLLKRAPEVAAPPAGGASRPAFPDMQGTMPKPVGPTLPSQVPLSDGSTIAKTNSGSDPAYEAFDQGRYLTALDLAQKAAERGEPQAHTLIGRLYQEGLGVGKSDLTAAQWYRKGAELGDTAAMFAFGVLLAEGGHVKRDRDGAAQMFDQAAQRGHILANYNLALLFLKGDGKPENPHRGAAHMRFAAEGGLPVAQYDLATLYATGTGVEANAAEAAKWFERAALAGQPDAELEYAIILFQGRGVPVDQARGAKFFAAAAAKGNVVAQNRLARCYAYGAGLPANAFEATKWHLIARKNGLGDPTLDDVAGKLSKADRAKAELAADAWREAQMVRAN